MRVAPEGRRVIGLAVIGGGVMAALGVAIGHAWLIVPAVAGAGFCCWFFRDPEREPPSDPRLVVSPADGRVLAVTPVEENDLLGCPTTRVSIFMSVFDVHVNRSPIGGVIEKIRYTPGKFYAAFADKSSDENERNAMILNDDGRRYLVVQIAGAVARRIVNRYSEGDTMTRGERYGMIMFGSRVDVYLPTDHVVRVRPKMRVRAGTSVIAEVPA